MSLGAVGRSGVGEVCGNGNSFERLLFFAQAEGIICERNLRLVNNVRFSKNRTSLGVMQVRFPFTEPLLGIGLCLSKPV